MAQGYLYAHTPNNAAPSTGHHYQVSWRLFPSQQLCVTAMAETKDRNYSFLNPHKGADLCSICDGDNGDDDDSDKKVCNETLLGSQLSGSDMGSSDTYKSLSRWVWLPLKMRKL